MIAGMFLKLIFKRWSVSKQADFMKRKGIVLGTRNKGGRTTYLYMVDNLFAEILYENDNPAMGVEKLIVINGLSKLHNHLEKELRSVFV